MTPADLRREAGAARERAEAETRDAWHRTLFGACIVAGAFGAKMEDGSSLSPHHYLPWVPAPVEAETDALTRDNVQDRFRIALERAGHTAPPNVC